MPSTYWTMLVGGLALAGIFPLSGFWSKDEILLEAYHHNFPLFVLGLAGAFLTAFYVMRMIFYTFLGTPRWRTPASPVPPAAVETGRATSEREALEAAHGHPGASVTEPHGVIHPHESPRVMTVPLWILAAFAAVAGLAAAPWWDNPFHHFVSFEGVEAPAFNLGLALLSTAVALAGILAAAVVYHWGWIPSASLRRAAGPLYTLLVRKYYWDELYAWAAVRPTVWAARQLRVFDLYVIDGAVNAVGIVFVWLARLYRLFDLYVVDGLVNLIGWAAKASGAALRTIQTGRPQNYLLVLALAVIVLVMGGILR